MNSQKKELSQLHKILTIFCTKNRAAHVAAHAPPTCRLRSAPVAAYAAAHVAIPERPESGNFSPAPVLIWLQKLAPQKRSWGLAGNYPNRSIL